jgi:hypothetical protein
MRDVADGTDHPRAANLPLSLSEMVDWKKARLTYINNAGMSYADVAAQHGCHKVTIQKRATRERWKEERERRAAFVHQKAAEKTVLSAVEELAQYNAADLQMAKALRSLAARRMSQGNLEPKDLRAIAGAIESAQRVARLALGAATQVSDVTLTEADRMSVEERRERIRQLHKQLFPDTIQ